jgi:hypothetical protein
MDKVAQIWGRGQLFIGQLEICPLEMTYPGNSGLGAEIPGFHLRRKFRPEGRKFCPPPPEIFISENSGPLLQVAPHLERKDLAKIHSARNFGISGPRKFWLLRISSTFLQAAPQPVVKDLAEFSRARNYEIPENSGKPEFLAPLQNVAPQRFVKDLAKFQRAGNPRGRNSGPGAEFLALGQNFRP